MRGGQSLTMARLRVKNDKERRALAAVWAPAGALVKDEFTQQPGALEHAIAVRAAYGRERHHNLRCADYASPQTNYASLPYVITAGDPLQFPPVPATSSLLAEPEGADEGIPSGPVHVRGPRLCLRTEDHHAVPGRSYSIHRIAEDANPGGESQQSAPHRGGVAGASEHGCCTWRISRRHRVVVSVRLCVVLCVHSAMGQVGPFSHAPSGNLVHVCP